MLVGNVLVRAIEPADRAAWVDMWSAYCAFYEVVLPERITRSTWQRITAGDVDMHGLLAVNASTGAAVGFANYVLHPYTWSDRPACYLEDLFVRTDARGIGIGRALIERLIALGEQHGWARLYWMTRETNGVARRLYDRFCGRDDFVRYDLPIAAAGFEANDAPHATNASDV